MAMKALPSNDFLNFLIYNNLSANPIRNTEFHQFGSSSSSDIANIVAYIGHVDNGMIFSPEASNNVSAHGGVGSSEIKKSTLGVLQAVGGKKKRRKRASVCKNKEDAETQRMTHIVVERNRRKQMNEHLSVLRSLMPQSYAQRGDQASIVGGAIEFVKELEHIVQFHEAQKYQLLVQQAESSHYHGLPDDTTTMTPTTRPSTPFSQFFTYPKYIWSQGSPANEYTTSTKADIADIEVEEGCPLNSVDDIAGAVHHMLRITEQEEESKEDADVAIAVAGMGVPKSIYTR